MALEVKMNPLRTFADDEEQGERDEGRIGSATATSGVLVSRLKKLIFGGADLAAVNDNARDTLSLADEGVRAFVDETVYRARRYQRPLSIILFDMAGTRSPAHSRNVAPEIAPYLRRLDLCLQLESEGLFLVLCPELNEDGVKAFAQRLTILIDELSGGADDGIEIRSATATLPGAATTFDGLLGFARQRLQVS